jgi:hypothetical protein
VPASVPIAMDERLYGLFQRRLRWRRGPHEGILCHLFARIDRASRIPIHDHMPAINALDDIGGMQIALTRDDGLIADRIRQYMVLPCHEDRELLPQQLRPGDPLCRGVRRSLLPPRPPKGHPGVLVEGLRWDRQRVQCR